MNMLSDCVLFTDLLPSIISLLEIPTLAVLVKTCVSIQRQVGDSSFAEKLASRSYGLRCNLAATSQEQLRRSSDGFHCIAPCEPRSLHCMIPCCLQAVHLGVQMRNVPSADVYFGRGGSSELQSECLPTVATLADVLGQHLGPHSGFHLRLFVAGHCGRGAPDFIQLPTTEERARSVCLSIADLLLKKGLRLGRLQMYIYGCKASVCRRDIEESGQQLDFSRAEVRLLAVGEGTSDHLHCSLTAGICPGERPLLEWGRRWWEQQKDGGAALPLPTYKAFDPVKELLAMESEVESDSPDADSAIDDQECSSEEHPETLPAEAAHIFQPAHRHL